MGLGLAFHNQPHYIILEWHNAGTQKRKKLIMFIQSRAATISAHKNGLALEQRRGGKDTLIQWPNGDQQWCATRDLDYTGSTITLIGGAEYSNNG